MARSNKPRIEDGIRGGTSEWHPAAEESAMHTGKYAHPKPRSKYKPKGIDPAYPNRNFVKMSYTNRGDDQGFFDYMYGSPSMPNNNFSDAPGKKSSGFGHGVERRVGKMRLSGAKNAHRIGKRT